MATTSSSAASRRTGAERLIEGARVPLRGVLVSQAIGQTLHRLGGDVVFGLMGSGNLAVTNAIVAAGGRFVSARHETGALCMADGYARVSGRLGVASVHQGPGLTNAITGLTEAAKSRTPLRAARRRHARRRSCARTSRSTRTRWWSPSARCPSACTGRRPRSPTSTRAVRTRGRRAARGRAEPAARRPGGGGRARPTRRRGPSSRRSGRRRSRGGRRRCWRAPSGPAIIGGRGAVLSGAGPALRRARRAQRRDPGDLGGGQRAVRRTTRSRSGSPAASPRRPAQRLLGEADVIVAFGAVAEHVDDAPRRRWSAGRDAWSRSTATRRRSARTGPVDLGVVGDARETAEALIAALTARRGERPRRRRAAASRSPPRSRPARWRDEPYEASRDWLDPRTLSIALDDMLPAERTVVVDSGAFMGYPSMYLRVPGRARASCSRRRSSASGSALGNAIGAAVARPDRLTVCAVGDGGLLMALPDLETLGRRAAGHARRGLRRRGLRRRGPPLPADGHPGRARPVPADRLRRAGRGRRLPRRHRALASRISRPSASGSRDRDRPLVLDAKVDPDICAEWLEEAFRGH